VHVAGVHAEDDRRLHVFKGRLHVDLPRALLVGPRCEGEQVLAL